MIVIINYGDENGYDGRLITKDLLVEITANFEKHLTSEN